MQALTIAAGQAADRPELLSLNESAVPHVNSVTLEALRSLSEQACYLGVARIGAELAGFLLALGPGQAYGSLNYRWFCQRYERFVYVDRIVVAEAFRGRGVGKLLYQHLERTAASNAQWVMCEVNLVPANPESLVFHHRLGFQEVGQQDTEGGKKRVSLLAKRRALGPA